MGSIEFLVLSLAAARIARLIVFDSGPANLIGSLRKKAGAMGHTVEPGSVGELFNCPWCVAFIASIVLTPAYFTFPTVTILFCVPLAMSFVSGAAVMLTRK